MQKLVLADSVVSTGIMSDITATECMNSSAKPIESGNAEDWEPGFLMERRKVRSFHRMHQHSGVEVAVTTGGTFSIMYGDSRIVSPPERLTVVWGAIAHGSAEVISGNPVSYSLHIPLAMFMRWELPASLLDGVVGGDVITDERRKRPCSDLDLMKNWYALLKEGDRIAEEIVAMEVNARLIRLARSLTLSRSESLLSKPITSSRENEILERLILEISRRHREKLSVSCIAAAAGISPSYAMSVFRHGCDMTILDYLHHCRITTAQQLLITTKDKMFSIAGDSGFGSVDSFYAAFKRIVGQTPQQFRKSIGK